MKAILEIFSKSQENISTHQKLLQRLKKIYKEGELNSVVSAILICVDVIFLEDYKTFHKRRTRVLAFLGQFLLDFLAEDTDEEAENPIVRTVIDRVLNHTEAVNPNLRYHSTRLLEVILKNISANVQVSAQLCDDIQDHLIDRLDTDSVLPIRVMSTSALEKLQDIDNSRCPVIDAYCRLCNDPNPTMRKLAVTHIAVTHSTRETLIKLTRDMDSMVRCEAFKRVSSINPSSFLKIIQRQQVIINGIEEEQLSVRKVFLNKLLPQWLKMYDDNLISFYNSVMLDAHQNDIEDTRKIHRELMKIFFTQFSAGEILQYLPIGTDALVPVNQLTSVISAYWYYFVVNLQNGDNFSVELENVLPQLTPLCEYITSVIKSKEGIHLEEWQKVQFQEVLYNLFNMVAISDLADEIGRKHLQPLLRETLVNVKLDKSVIEVILETYKAFFTDTEQLSIDICTIMSEIRESVIANEEEIALNNTQRMEIMASQFNLYSDTMCRCLDILSIFLKKTKFQQLPLSLRVCLNELVRPAMQSEDINVHGRIFLVLGQFCVLDKNIAMEDAHYICSPLIATKYGRYDKNSIIPSVQAISDIICVHGTEILGDEIEESFNVTSINSSQLRRRKLYQEVPAEEILAQCMNVTRGLIMDIMLDLLEEEDDDIRHLAAKSLMKLVMKGLLVNSSLLTRIMLKWLNPCIEKHDPAMQQTIGDGLLHYAMNIKNSNMIIYRAIVPILNTIGNAPENSPFGDVVVESVLMYLHNMIQLQSTDNFDVDKNLMLDIIQEIKNRPKTKSTYILSKMLLVLKLPKETDENFLADCTKEVDIAIQFVIDVKVRKLLIKFKQQLNTLHKSTENSRAVEVTATESIANGTILTNSEADEINLNSRATNNENADCTSDSDESTLVNSIIEDSFSSTDSSVKKRTAKNRTLRVLIERTSINKLKQLAKSQKSATETPALKASKRKRGRPSNGSRRDLSELLETSNMHMLTRSGRKVRTPAISESSSEECISRKSRRQS